ncbi:LPXTG cell wall anchor domain-containing protein [Micromonospora chokoriensis]
MTGANARNIAVVRGQPFEYGHYNWMTIAEFEDFNAYFQALPVTGQSTGLIAGLGALLLAAGVGGYLAAKRSRTRFVV